ncbi:BCCT family transporter, partial [Ursidibacter arcticus]
WREQLNKIIVDFTELDVKNFLKSVAKPAFHLVSLELSSYSIKAKINSDNKTFIEIVIPQSNKHDFIYGIRCSNKTQGKFEPITYFSDGRNGYDVKFMHKEELITDILRQYDLYLNLIKDDKHALKTSIE